MALLRKQGFPYAFDPAACATCSGRCCRGESGNIWVTRSEIDRIVAFLGTNLVAFMAGSVRQVEGRLSLKERWAGEEALCIFFNERINGCRIYPVRPLQCREFPFWDYFRDVPEELAGECPGVRLFGSSSSR
ncbi:MAG: YkgJ family cysteine cluster protein [Desulfobulbus sp.]|nr:MAG: YkgJ family cysteine cluster protein [Desulfobulbus sp.]